MRFRLSGFGDEISDELSVQLRVMSELGVDALEPRRVQLPGGNTKNIVEMSDAELQVMRRMLDDHGMACSQIGSPVGKAPLDSDLEVQVQQLEGAVRAAHILDADYIRVFGFQPVQGDPLPADRPAALGKFQRLAEHLVSLGPGLTLSLENEHDLYDDTPVACSEFLALGGAPISMCFDPGNFVRAGVSPFDDAWPVLGAATQMIHVKDYDTSIADWAPAGAGDGQLADVLGSADPKAVAYLSLEPHLAGTAAGRGRDRAELWREAHAALMRVLNSQ
ncbi:MAG: TIM barrel protein [Chloroflexi bacterium]|nr:TIM barrel protein [Chloroflexota bacterium]